MTRPATLAELDGLTFRNNSARLPHPADLARWAEAGFYIIDADNDCFQLTDVGKRAVAAFDRRARNSYFIPDFGRGFY